MISARLLLSLGFPGDYYLHGIVSNDGVHLSATAIPNNAIGEAITKAIGDGVKTILNVDSGGPMAEAIDDAFGNKFRLNEVKFELDTRRTSENKQMKLKIDMTILGNTVNFSIEIGLNTPSRVT